MRKLLLLGMIWNVAAAGAATCGSPSVVTDAATGQGWQRILDCEHPEQPARLIPVSKSELHTLPAAAAHAAREEVRAGSTVNLWSGAGAVMHVKSVALENALVGQPVHVRGVMGSATLRGIVRGPGSVELTPAGWGEKR
jgi:hypothetical protein